MTIKITEQKAQQFNTMLYTLRKIAKVYMSPDKIRKNCEKDYGLEFEECIEMVYDNIQGDAEAAARNVRPIEITKLEPLTH
jgi:hypothetical protein